MNKYLITMMVVVLSTAAIAQKKELKSAQSAIDTGDFSSAKGALTQAEALKSAMDDKTLAKYYFLNGLALASNGTASNADMKAALASFDEMKTVESRIGKSTYSSQVMESTQSMKRSLADRAQVALENEDYTSSSENFEFIFRLQPTDTLYLYNAAVLATQAKAYPRALGLYDELTKLGFTGVATEYSAVNAETGEEVLFESEFMRDISVKAGTHTDPKVTTTKSKVGDIARNIAVIYIELNDNEKAIQAIEEAKRIYPDDFSLIVTEANIMYQIGDMAAYEKLISKALELQPDNVHLIFNLGVVSSDNGQDERAMEFYLQALKVDPSYNNARMNISALYFDKVEAIVETMNSLGNSRADNAKYDKLNLEKNEIYKQIIPYLEDFLTYDSDNLDVNKTLMNIYSALGDYNKVDEFKAKIEKLEDN